MKNVYQFFSRPGFLSSSYTLKFLFIAFIGVHIPLIVLIMAIVFEWMPLKGWNVIQIALLATLVATGLTLLLLKSLLWPIIQAKNALQDYTRKKIIPVLLFITPMKPGNYYSRFRLPSILLMLY